MPELPEVQTVVSNLAPKIKNKTILDYRQFWHKVNYTQNNSILKKEINKLKIIDVDRKGKYIIIILKKYYLVFHLRMTGYLHVLNKLPKNRKHMRCYFKLTDSYFLIFEDIRKFGGFYFLKNLEFINKKIGIDALDEKLTLNYLFQKTSKVNRKIKYFLLDQKYICGLGNIYIDEILWDCKIHPEKITSKIKKNKINELIYSIKKNLNKSIKHHGTTILNFKFDNMKSGNYKSELKAYGLDNTPCCRCKNNIIKKKICGRTSFYCPSCQKL